MYRHMYDDYNTTNRAAWQKIPIEPELEFPLTSLLDCLFSRRIAEVKHSNPEMADIGNKNEKA